MMQGFLTNFVENVKKMESFAVQVFFFGLRLTFGLILLSGLFYFLAGRYGNIISALTCAKGALDAAQAMLLTTFVSALISDVAIKDRARRS